MTPPARCWGWIWFLFWEKIISVKSNLLLALNTKPSLRSTRNSASMTGFSPMTPERALAKWLLDALPPNSHAQRIEVTTGRGVPDLNLCGNGREWWLELKADHKLPLLRPEQFAWLTRRHNAGGLCGVIHRPPGWKHWHFHCPSSWRTETQGPYVAIISGSLASGETGQHLATFLFHV